VFFTSGQYHGAMPSELPYIASKGALHQLTPSFAAHPLLSDDALGTPPTYRLADPGCHRLGRVTFDRAHASRSLNRSC